MTAAGVGVASVDLERLQAERLTLEVGSRIEGLVRTEQECCYYVTSGYGILHVDVWSYPIEPGSAIWVPAGTGHALENTGADPLIVVRFGCGLK